MKACSGSRSFLKPGADSFTVGSEVYPKCGNAGGLERHGTYGRDVTTGSGQVATILVARFRCLGCERTVSYLPAFALSYRLVSVPTVEAYPYGDYGPAGRAAVGGTVAGVGVGRRGKDGAARTTRGLV